MRIEIRGQKRTINDRHDKNLQWKRRRQRQVRCYLLSMVLAAVLTAGCVFSLCILITKAQEEEEVSFKYYTSIQVSYGESLWSIARTYQDDHYDCTQDYVDEVIHINHLKDGEDITAGQYLIIPYYSSKYIK